MENGKADEDIGDKCDGLWPLADFKVSFFSENNDQLTMQFQCSSAIVDLGYTSCPVLCMFMLDKRNITSISEKKHEATVRYDFTDEQRKKLALFGDSVLLITNANEFVRRTKEGFLSTNTGFSRDYVSYYDGNCMQHIRDLDKNNSRIAFWKRAKYHYQQEYRFLAHYADCQDSYTINIGDIGDISVIKPIEDVLNSYIEITYDTKNQA